MRAWDLTKGVLLWAFIGWVVAYNVIRILTGDEPDAVFFISLPVGAIAGGALYLLVIRPLMMRFAGQRLALHGEHAEGELEQPQEDALRLSAWTLVVFGAVAAVMGVLLVIDFLSAASGDRPVTSIVLGAWNIVAALWVADEIARLRVFDVTGLDFGVGMTSLTAIMAALGLARDFFPAGQIVLLVVAAVAGAIVGLASWRLAPARRIPILAPVAIIVPVVALLLATLG